MKIAVALILSILVVVHGEYAKRQITDALIAKAPSLAKLALDKLGINKLIGNVGSFFSGQSGTTSIPDTPFVLSYNIHKCHLHIGKRFLIHHVAEERCTADVCENTYTKSCKSCTEGHQEDALKCALKDEVAEMARLLNEAKAQQG